MERCLPCPRRLLLLRGSEEQTRKKGLALIDALAPRDVLWVGPKAELGAFEATSPGAARKLLGNAFDVVVLDLHRKLDADLLGRCHGYVWGGGALILRMPEPGVLPTEEGEGVIVPPFSARDVGHRFYRRFEAIVEKAASPIDGQIAPFSHETSGTEEQRRVVERLIDELSGERGELVALTADRGRGKSSALGLAARALVERGVAPIGITAAERSSLVEVLRFALGSRATEPPSPEAPIRVVSPRALLEDEPRFEVIVVDEAAQLPVPLLSRLVAKNESATIAFATTVRGYEGTGRGFSLRFLSKVERGPRRLARLTLEEPIRHAADDPVEAALFDALLLDAEPSPAPADLEWNRIRHAILDRDRLAEDDTTLRAFFGLLVHAHYRTTPADLHRILDAPNLELHALLLDDQVLAASTVALEGGLDEATIDDLHWGRRGIRGHALPDSLVSHLGHREAGSMRMVRSVRVATHPELRRLGLGSMLVERVHRAYSPDLFGTLFGATPELLRFRRSLGYHLVRMSASRGVTTGEPSVLMLRPESRRAEELVDRLRAELARDLPLQLRLIGAEESSILDVELERELRRSDVAPAPLYDETKRTMVATYAFGARTVHATIAAVRPYVEERAPYLETLPDEQRRLIESRLLRLESFEAAARHAGLESPKVAKRALRRAVRALVERADPELAAWASRARGMG